MKETVAVKENPEKSEIFIDKLLGLFTVVKPGEAGACLVLLLAVFLILAAYYLIKPVREGWLAVSAIKGLSKLEVKAYAGFGQSLLLLGLLPLYGGLANRYSRFRVISVSMLFFIASFFLLWTLRPGFLAERIPFVGVFFYLWVGIFSVAVVAQFWAFTADFYSNEAGKRLIPLIAVGASAGAVAGAWFTEKILKTGALDSFHLILLSSVPLCIALLLLWIAEKKGPSGKKNQPGLGRLLNHGDRGNADPLKESVNSSSNNNSSDNAGGVFELLLKNRYVLAAALLGLFASWVNTNGENILYGFVQHALEYQVAQAGTTDPAVVARFVKDGTAAFYGNLYFWVNLCGFLLQALVVSRILKYGRFAGAILATPLVSFISYSLMAVFPVLTVVRWTKVAENSTNYSVNNTARHVLWLPVPAKILYKGKAVADTLFVRSGDALAALTVLAGTRFLGFSFTNYAAFNMVLILGWSFVAVSLIRQNKRLTIDHVK